MERANRCIQMLKGHRKGRLWGGQLSEPRLGKTQAEVGIFVACGQIVQEPLQSQPLAISSLTMNKNMSRDCAYQIFANSKYDDVVLACAKPTFCPLGFPV